MSRTEEELNELKFIAARLDIVRKRGYGRITIEVQDGRAVLVKMEINEKITQEIIK